MKCFQFGFCNFAFCIGLVFLLKMNFISSIKYDTLGKAKFPSLYYSIFPNRNYTWNTIMTPFAPRYALLAASVVAKRQTKSELKKALLYDLEPKSFFHNHLHYSVDHNFKELKDENGWKVRVFLNEKMDVTPCIKERISEFVQYINYAKKNVTDTVNSWVEERTNGIVKRIMARDLPKATFVTLVHVEYLDTLWKKPFVNVFNKRTKVNGKLLRGTMIQQDNEFLYKNLTDWGVEAVELPLNNNARMLVLQPYNTADLKDNFNTLKKHLLNVVDIRKISSKLENKKISVYFPVLTDVYARRHLGNSFKRIGVRTAFSKNADFSKIHSCGEESYIYGTDQSSLINTDLTYLRIGSATDVKWIMNPTISLYSTGFTDDEAEDYEEDEENSEDVESETEVTEKRDESLPQLVLERFFFAIIKDETPLFMGSIVKFHNRKNPGFSYVG